MSDLFRKTQRELSAHERYLIRCLKQQAEQLYATISQVDNREMALARTKLEEAVMWASKGITA